VDALDLIMLGRRLTRIGEAVLRDSAAQPMPNGQGLVLRDVLASPGSSISEITVRTGLPQSYVSQTVAGFRDRGLLETSADAHDGRRTLVRVSAQHLRDVATKGSAPAGTALAGALGDPGTGPAAAELIAALTEVAARLRPAQPGPILRSVSAAESGE
jgi:DNA-binding MarR family transcriptional regulator